MNLVHVVVAKKLNTVAKRHQNIIQSTIKKDFKLISYMTTLEMITAVLGFLVFGFIVGFVFGYSFTWKNYVSYVLKDIIDDVYELYRDRFYDCKYKCGHNTNAMIEKSDIEKVVAKAIRKR